MSDTPTVVQALTRVMRDVQAVAKKDRNTHQNFNFRGIDAVVNAVGPALREHGVVVVPQDPEIIREQVEVGQKRSLMASVTVKVTYRFYGPAGDHIDTRVAGEAMDAGDKATPKAMSVAFRTALLQALSLPTDEPDPDTHTYERAPAETMTTLLARLDQAVVEAREAGVEGDFDATRAWASESPDNARAAIARIVKATAEHREPADA